MKTIILLVILSVSLGVSSLANGGDNGGDIALNVADKILNGGDSVLSSGNAALNGKDVALGGVDLAFGLKFMLDFRSVESAITAASMGNQLDAASVVSVNGGASAETMVHQRLVDVVTPLYPWQVKQTRSIYLPQDLKVETVDGTETRKVNPVSISFSGSAIKSERQTTYVRFRWAGPIDETNPIVGWLILNGYNWETVGERGGKGVGWGIGVRYNNGTSPHTGHLVMMVPQATLFCSWNGTPVIERDVWYDLFIDIEPNPDDITKSKIVISILKPTNLTKDENGESVYVVPKLSKISLLTQFKCHEYASSSSALKLGAESSSVKYESTTANYNGFLKAFRGDVARLMTWERILSEEEKFHVMDSSWSETFRLGIENSSSAEFSDLAADVVWAAGESWSKVPKKLSATNPELVIRDEVPECETGIGKVLYIKPLYGDGSLPVEVSVNGEKVGEYDLSLSTGRSIYIPGEKWCNGGSGYAEIKIKRIPPFEGVLEFDAISLGGGWRVSGDMSREGYVRSLYYTGQRDSKAMQRATISSKWNPYPAVHISSYIPRDSLSGFRRRLTVNVKGGNNDVVQTFWANGSKFAEFTTSRTGAEYSAQVPQNLLKEVENIFTVSNAVPVGEQVKWVRYSDYAIEVKPYRGFMFIVR